MGLRFTLPRKFTHVDLILFRRLGLQGVIGVWRVVVEATVGVLYSNHSNQRGYKTKQVKDSMSMA